MTVTSLLSFKNDVFSYFAFYSAAVLLKMIFVAMYTSVTRLRKSSYANPEDVAQFYKGNNPDKKKVKLDDPDVERVRRLHLNDLENIPAFIFAGLLYVVTGPNPYYALWHFRGYCISRFIHTFSYLSGVQPWRALAHTVCAGITVSMLVQTLMEAKW